MEDTKRPVFGAEAERIGTRLDEATDEFLKDGELWIYKVNPGKAEFDKRFWSHMGHETSPLWLAAGDQELPGLADPPGSGSAHSHGAGSTEITRSG